MERRARLRRVGEMDERSAQVALKLSAGHRRKARPRAGLWRLRSARVAKVERGSRGFARFRPADGIYSADRNVCPTSFEDQRAEVLDVVEAGADAGPVPG